MIEKVSIEGGRSLTWTGPTLRASVNVPSTSNKHIVFAIGRSARGG
jgi:hypothetical protein